MLDSQYMEPPSIVDVAGMAATSGRVVVGVVAVVVQVVEVQVVEVQV